MPDLPQHFDITAPSGPQWSRGFILTNEDRTPVDLTNSTFEFVIRPYLGDVTEPAMISVSMISNGQGQITVSANVVTVVLNPAATALLGQGARPYALWQNPNQVSETVWAEGTFSTGLVAAA